MNDNRTLMIGTQRVNIDTMTTKVERDIAFLKDRIGRLTQQRTPNQATIQTYKTMLFSRKSVLAWLHEHLEKMPDTQQSSLLQQEHS